MNEIMLFTETLMDLEAVTLSETSQTGKDKYHMVTLYRESKKEIQQSTVYNCEDMEAT